MAFWAALIGGIIVMVIMAVAKANNRKDEFDSQQKFIEKEKIIISNQYLFQNSTNDISARFIVDDVNRAVFVAQTSAHLTEIPYSEISGCEVLENSQVTGGVGRAVVGGILAGGVGAVIGAATAKNKITSYKVIIYRNNIETPQFTLTLINTPTEVGSIDYKRASEFAANVVATIRVIQSQPTMNYYQSSRQLPQRHPQWRSLSPREIKKEPEPEAPPPVDATHLRINPKTGEKECPGCGRKRTSPGICPYCNYPLSAATRR